MTTLVLTLLVFLSSAIGDYPSVTSPDFVWLSTPSGPLRYDRRADEWSFVAPDLKGAELRDIGLDEEIVWIATDRGVASAPVGSADWRLFTQKDGLPSDDVTSLAFHPDYVWAGTEEGVARFDKYVEEWETIPQSPVHVIDLAVQGETVWVISGEGIFSVEAETGDVKRYPVEGEFLELILIGADVWFIGDGETVRYLSSDNLWRRYTAEQGAPKGVISLEVEGERIWIATPDNLYSYDRKLGRWTEFLPLRTSPIKGEIKDIAPAGGALWVLTSEGVSRYDRTKATWRRYDEMDGLKVKEGLSLTAAGNYLFVVGAESVAVYDGSRDAWRTYPYDSIELPSETGAPGLISLTSSGLTLTVSEEMRLSVSGISSVGFEMKPEFGGISYWNSLSLSGDLPGDRRISGIYDDVRKRRFRMEYRGVDGDIVKGIELGEVTVRSNLQSLLDDRELWGGKVKGETGSVQSELWLAREMGVPSVDLLRGKLTEREIHSYRLSHKELIPYSERVFVDGELMQRNVHYLIDYTLGRLVFTDPELIDPDSRIRVEYHHRPESSRGNAEGIGIRMGSDRERVLAGLEIFGQPVPSGDFTSGGGFVRIGNDRIRVHPEIAWAHTTPDGEGELAGAATLTARVKGAEVRGGYRRFTPDFPSVIPRTTYFGRANEGMNLSASASLSESSRLKLRLSRGSSDSAEDNLAMLKLIVSPEGLPAVTLSGRYDEVEAPGVDDRRLGGKVGMGYEVPEETLKRVRLSELGLRSNFGFSHLNLEGKKEFRYDIYWNAHARMGSGLSVNLRQRYFLLPSLRIRRSGLGAYLSPFSGLNVSLYLDEFRVEGDSPAKFESLISVNGAVLPGFWSERLKWIDLFGGYNVVDRPEGLVRSTLFRPIIRISPNLIIFTSWIWNEREGDRVNSELIYSSKLGRTGLEFSGRSRPEDGTERRIAAWHEFRIGEVMNGLRLTLSLPPEDKLTLSPEYIIRSYLARGGMLKGIYVANSISAMLDGGAQISETILLELVTGFNLSLRLSGSIAHDYVVGETKTAFSFRAHAKM
jgi:frataxin-like iron-binding protein CyaY